VAKAEIEHERNPMSDDGHVVEMRHQAACFESNARAQEYDNARDAARPSMRLRPRLSIDGNKWCALYGDNLQDGVAGFGDSPAEAMAAFDDAWVAKLPAKLEPTKEPTR
jgi:hypothetical protein